MANLSLNPMATTNAAGSFGVQSDGFIQGVALDDPANRFNRRQAPSPPPKPSRCGVACRLPSCCPA